MAFSHTEADNRAITWEQESCTSPPFLCLSLSLMCCHVFWHASTAYLSFSHFLMSVFLVEVKSSSAAPGALHAQGKMGERRNQREDKRSDLAIKCKVDKWLLLFDISVCIYMRVCVPVCEHALL